MYIQDGKNLELVCLGHAVVEWNGEYVPFKKSVELVQSTFCGDPSDPDCRFANDLHALVALELGLENWSELEYYPAVGSPLDFYHGADAIFVFRGKVVTIDGTCRGSKKNYKADVLVSFNWSKPELSLVMKRVANLLAA